MSPPIPRIMTALLLAGAGCGLSACAGGGLARNFGFVRDAPDEYTVTTQAPLSMPPDYSLRPPRPGAPRPQDRSERLQAEEALAPQVALSDVQPNAAVSPGQQALLAEVGPPAPAGIRNEVDQQAAEDKPSQGFIDRLMFWRAPPEPGTVVDPQKEAERLRRDAALGESPTVGDISIIKNKPKGILEGIF
jgi:hypothetical protein